MLGLLGYLGWVEGQRNLVMTRIARIGRRAEGGEEEL